MDYLDNASHELDRFFELALDHLVVAGYDGYFKRLSRAWTATLGWSEEELRARPIHAFVHPEDRVTVLSDREGIKRGIPLIGRVNRYQCKDGSWRWFEWRTVAYPERELIYAVARDVTHQKQLERQREEARAQLAVSERMATLGRLAAGVAHEVNNPLSYVMSNLRMALEEVRAIAAGRASAPPAELEAMLADALDGAERVSRVVGSLQILAGAERERQVPVEVQESVALALSLAGPRLRRRARLIESRSQTPQVLVDPARLGEAVLNLLLNAADAIPDGPPDGHEIRVATYADEARRAVVEIADSGVGIPAELQSRIFEPFFSTRRAGQGVGLGLSIARSIVTAAGGDLGFESVPGRGTTFRIRLPPAP